MVENDKKRIREEVKTRRSNVSTDKPDHSYGRRGHDSYDRQAKAPRLYNEVLHTNDKLLHCALKGSNQS